MSAFDRLLRPLRARVAGMVARGVLRLVVPGEQFDQLQVQIYDDDPPQDGVEFWQGYGLSTRPAPGGTPLLLAVGGSRAHTVAVSVADNSHRPKDLQDGEVSLYTLYGDEIRLKKGRVIAIKAAEEVQVDAPKATFTGLVYAEDVIVGGISMKRFTLEHTHKMGGLPAGESAVPTPLEPEDDE